MHALILATQSRYKSELMSRLGIEFEIHAAEVDESRHWDEPPEQMALRLAEQKARKVASFRPDAYVLGADQVAFFDATVLGKPGTRERAIEQLLLLQGRAHTLMSAIALAYPDGHVVSSFAKTTMEMRSLNRSQIEAYVDRDSPLDCAGSYKVEAAGIRLFHRMPGDDYTNIIGLPLTRVVDLLTDAGLM